MARPSDYPARGLRDYGYRYVASTKPDGQCSTSLCRKARRSRPSASCTASASSCPSRSRTCRSSVAPSCATVASTSTRTGTSSTSARPQGAVAFYLSHNGVRRRRRAGLLFGRFQAMGEGREHGAAQERHAALFPAHRRQARERRADRVDSEGVAGLACRRGRPSGAQVDRRQGVRRRQASSGCAICSSGCGFSGSAPPSSRSRPLETSAKRRHEAGVFLSAARTWVSRAGRARRSSRRRAAPAVPRSSASTRARSSPARSTARSCR